MTTHVAAPPTARSFGGVLLAVLAGLVAMPIVAAGWGVVTSLVWGPGHRLAVFIDPGAARPTGYLARSLLFTVGAGALIGAGLALARRRFPAGRWVMWAGFAAGVALFVGYADVGQPVVLQFVASSALGFRLDAHR